MTARIRQLPILVLWGSDASAVADQLAVLVLTTPPRRRVIALTD